MQTKAGAPAPNIGFASPAALAALSRRILFLATPAAPPDHLCGGVVGRGTCLPTGLRPPSARPLRASSARAGLSPAAGAPSAALAVVRAAGTVAQPLKSSSAVQIQFAPGKENRK